MTGTAGQLADQPIVHFELVAPTEEDVYAMLNDLALLRGRSIPLWLAGIQYQAVIVNVDGPFTHADDRSRIHIALLVDTAAEPLPADNALTASELTFLGWRVNAVNPPSP